MPQDDTAREIGEALLQAGILTRVQLDSALRYQKEIGGRLGHIIVKLGYVQETRLLDVLSRQMRIPLFDVEGFTPAPEILSLIPTEVLERLNAIPIRKEMGVLIVGVSDPTDFAGIDELRMHAGGGIETALVSPAKTRDALNRLFHTDAATAKRPSQRSSVPRRGRQRLSELVRDLEAQMRVQIDPHLANFSTDQLLLGLIAALASRGLITAQEIEDACGRLRRLADETQPAGAKTDRR